jgi:hypothetical protein
MYDDRLSLRVGVSVGRKGVIFGQHANLSRLFLLNWLNLLEPVEGVQRRNRQAVPYDRKEDEPIHHRDHGTDKIFLLLRFGILGFWEQVTCVLNVEDSSDAWR